MALVIVKVLIGGAGLTGYRGRLGSAPLARAYIETNHWPGREFMESAPEVALRAEIPRLGNYWRGAVAAARRSMPRKRGVRRAAIRGWKRKGLAGSGEAGGRRQASALPLAFSHPRMSLKSED